MEKRWGNYAAGCPAVPRAAFMECRSRKLKPAILTDFMAALP